MTLPSRAFRTLIVLLSYILSLNQHHCQGARPPNVIVFFVDDMGYGDLGVQGNASIQSPHIDGLAGTGVRFTQWISASAICTPSRGALMTGRLPIRLGLSSSNYMRRVFSPISPGGLALSELTIAEALKERGYRTHMTGKWHLGIGENGAFLPTNHGFDSYYGMGVTNVQTCRPGKYLYHSTLWQFVFNATLKVWVGFAVAVIALFGAGFNTLAKLSVILAVFLFYAIWVFASTFTLMNPENCLLYRDTEIVQQPVDLTNLTQRHTADAQRFLKGAINDPEEKPWFLYLSYAKVHTALFNNPEFDSVSSNEYINNIAELDWSIGEILSFIEPQRDNTIIWFSSDNGPYLERGNEGGCAGRLRDAPLRGGKGQVWEGGIRVPGIVNFRSTFPSGKVTEEAVSTMDIMPTTLALVDQALDTSSLTLTPPRSPVDGKNLINLIMAAGSGSHQETSPHDIMFHYCGKELAAVRVDSRYKAIFATPVWEPGTVGCPKQSVCGCDGNDVQKHSPPLLFDVRADPSETITLVPSNFSGYDRVMERVKDAVKAHYFEEIKWPHHPNQVEMIDDPFLLPCCTSSQRPTLVQLFTRQCACDNDSPIEVN